MARKLSRRTRGPRKGMSKGMKPTSAPQVSKDVMTPKNRERMWHRRFRTFPVVYNAQNSRPRDVRTFIFDRSYLLEDVVKRYRLKAKTDDETMIRCCLFVQDHIRYVSDETSKRQKEFWQNPEDTISLGTGDCEDGAILMKSLTLIAGIPDWKVRIFAGKVRGGGHAYCTYIRDDNMQVIMDWCYWPTRVRVDKRKTIAQDERYGEVWFSFNYAYSYSGRPLAYSNGKVEK